MLASRLWPFLCIHINYPWWGLPSLLPSVLYKLCWNNTSFPLVWNATVLLSKWNSMHETSSACVPQHAQDPKWLQDKASLIFLTCDLQHCWCPDHLYNGCIFLATLNRDQEQALSNQFLWWQLPPFLRKLCGLVGAGKNPNALPFLHQKRKLPLGNRRPSSAANLGWELNKITLPT